MSIVLRFLLLSLLLLSACGSQEGDRADAGSSSQWLSVTASTATGEVAELSGTAWVSQSWSAYHCIGLGCLFDTRTDDYPGVTVSWTNRTTGSSGRASSQYGGGTGWRHVWYATVPLAQGVNTIDLSALDPDGKGGAVSISVERR